MKTARQILIDAKALIADPARWSKGLFYNGRKCSYCAVGALNVASGCETPYGAGDNTPKGVRIANQTARRFLDHAVNSYAPSEFSVMSFNDKPRTSHEDVMRVFDKAIEAAAS